MIRVSDIADWMQQLAPLELGESWDNVGLLLGDPQSAVHRMQTCLTLTEESVGEAVKEGVEMIIAHHPLPFKPLSRITRQTPAGDLLWRLARAGISVYSPHTAWDSAESGINALLAEKLELRDVQPIQPSLLPGLGHLGAGRIGGFPQPRGLSEIADSLRRCLPESRMRWAGTDKPIERVAIACGSGGSLLGAAAARGCDLFLTGEATFHHCLESQALGIAMLLTGHFASERFSLEHLAGLAQVQFPTLRCWASKNEQDPVRNAFPTASS